MKKIKIILGAMLCGTLVLGVQSCKKSNTTIQNPTSQTSVDNSGSQRMWTTGKQLYAVGHDAAMQAFLYPLSYPGAIAVGTPSVFSVGATNVTAATGVAFINTNIIISTAATSNYPNKLLIYPAVGPYVAPTIVNCAGITDIEFNEYDGKLYGILQNNHIVRIAPASGSFTINLSPTIPLGSKLAGLCNYSGLLSYCISDASTAPDNFYSYNPAFPAATAPLFSADWGTGNGGMQYCNGFGWEIITPTDDHKSVSGAYVVGTFATIPGGPYKISDLTSN